MSQVDRFTAAAFLRLKAPEFEPYVKYLEQVYQKSLEQCSTVADAENWRKLQGRAQLAKELLDLVESSSSLVAKFDGRP